MLLAPGYDLTGDLLRAEHALVERLAEELAQAGQLLLRSDDQMLVLELVERVGAKLPPRLLRMLDGLYPRLRTPVGRAVLVRQRPLHRRHRVPPVAHQVDEHGVREHPLDDPDVTVAAGSLVAPTNLAEPVRGVDDQVTAISRPCDRLRELAAVLRLPEITELAPTEVGRQQKAVLRGIAILGWACSINPSIVVPDPRASDDEDGTTTVGLDDPSLRRSARLRRRALSHVLRY